MKPFSDFNIKPTVKAFVGDKIKIERVLNKLIEIHGFKINPSKIEGKGMCLTLQIKVDGSDRILFTGGKVLQETIQQVPAENFPFTATIVKENERLEFK
jgi:hypothetical protein